MTKNELKSLIMELAEEVIIENSQSVESYLESTDYWEDINITPQQILEFCGDYDIEEYVVSLNEAAMPNIFKKVGLGSAKIGVAINKAGKDIVKEIKSNGINKDTKQSISSIIMDTYKELADNIEGDDIDWLQFEKYDANKIRKSFKILLSVLISNTLCQVVLIMLFGP